MTLERQYSSDDITFQNLAVYSLAACSCFFTRGNWPQAAGPNQNWAIKTHQPVPLKWSAERNENIRWRLTLPEGGQSGIAVWEDRLFLKIMKPMAADALEKQGTDIVLYCVSASDGKILWQRDLAGVP